MVNATAAVPLPQVFGKRTLLKLSLIFGLIYFLSPNGLASLPGLTVSFLLKDTLGMSATQAAYFGALAILAWAVKPLWGVISDTFPIFGSRRKSYLILSSLLAMAAWGLLAATEAYTVPLLLLLFSVSSLAYAFQDVVTDGLMVETGKPLGLTGRFQAVQWGSVYAASVVTGLAGGYAAEYLKPQQTFLINALFPLILLAAVVFLVREERMADTREHVRRSFGAVKEASSHSELWLLAFFLFFWTFSPSFGTPFFYYAVDTLKFPKTFFGLAASVSSATAVLGAVLYGWSSRRFRPRTLIHFAVALGIVATLFDLIYLTGYVKSHLGLARGLYLSSGVVLGAIAAVIFLTMMNLAPRACPRYAEGTVFAFLMSFWNIGQIGSQALGGWLFSLIGLSPLIVVSAIFTAAVWLLTPFLNLGEGDALAGFEQKIRRLFLRPAR